MYQLLSGHLPFPQKEPSALIAAIMMREFDPLPYDVPQSLKTVLAKALAKQPENRYASAGEMREDLRRFLRGEMVSDLNQFYLPPTQKSIPVSEMLPTQKSLPIFGRDSQAGNENIFRPVAALEQNEKRESSNVWTYATIALVLVCAIGLSVYLKNSLQIKEITLNFIKNSNNKTPVATHNSNSSKNLANNTNTNIATPMPTPDKSQLKQIMNRYLAGVAKVNGMIVLGSQITYGDLDNDGDEDAAVEFQTGYKGGNGYGFFLAVFRNNEGQFEAVTDVYTGGKLSRTPTLKQIKNGKILFDTLSLDEDDSYCCPSIKGKTSYTLQGNTLVESK
ncbi:MAG: hypothetical protein WKF74_11290 [Pyrinomonadaceae bacterium]